jgi:hypothetical protein
MRFNKEMMAAKNKVSRVSCGVCKPCDGVCQCIHYGSVCENGHDCGFCNKRRTNVRGVAKKAVTIEEETFYYFDSNDNDCIEDFFEHYVTEDGAEFNTIHVDFVGAGWYAILWTERRQSIYMEPITLTVYPITKFVENAMEKHRSFLKMIVGIMQLTYP